MTVTVHFAFYPLTTRRFPPSSKYYGPKKDCLCRPASVWVRERTLAWSHLGALTPWGPPPSGEGPGAPCPPPSLPTQSRAGARRADNGKRIRNSSPKFFLLGAGGGIGPDTAAQRRRRPPTPWPRGAHSSSPSTNQRREPAAVFLFPFHPLPHPLILREKLR